MLCASREGDLDRVSHLVSQQPALRTCQYNYTPPLHFAVREGHVALVRSLIVEGAFDPRYKTYPFGDSLMTMAQDRNLEAIAGILEEALGRLEWTRKLV